MYRNIRTCASIRFWNRNVCHVLLCGYQCWAISIQIVGITGDTGDVICQIVGRTGDTGDVSWRLLGKLETLGMWAVRLFGISWNHTLRYNFKKKMVMKERGRQDIKQMCTIINSWKVIKISNTRLTAKLSNYRRLECPDWRWLLHSRG